MARGRRNRGGGGGAGGGGGRGRGTVSTDDIQRVAETVREAAARHGIQITDMGTGGWSPQMQFLLACEDGDIDRLKVVVDNMDEDDRESLASVRMGGCGPLHSAASSGNVEICKYLVEQLGFDVDSDADNQDSGVTPLYCAAMEGKVVTAKYFLDKGADPNNKDSKGLAPLHEAAAAGYDDITGLLLSNGADVDVSSPEGTPLVVAAAHGKFSVMKILLEHHADPNKVSWKFGTPLTTTLYATTERMDEPTCLKCMKLLVKAGADVKCTIPETPLVIATSRGLTKCAEYFEVCAKANGPVNDDNTTDKDRKAQLKSSGAKAVERKDYATASKFYTEAIELDPADAVLYSNRSLCHLKSDEEHNALLDANACISLLPGWNKGYYRKGAALMSLLEYKEASEAFLAGLKLKPGNKEMEEAYRAAVEAMRKEQSEPSLYELD